MNGEPEEKQRDSEEPNTITITTTSRPREFSFWKMAAAWSVVILAIVAISIIVDVAIYGW